MGKEKKPGNHLTYISHLTHQAVDDEIMECLTDGEAYCESPDKANFSEKMAMIFEDLGPAYVYFAPNLRGTRVKIGSSYKVYSRLDKIGSSFDWPSVIGIKLYDRAKTYDLEFRFIKYFAEYQRNLDIYDTWKSGYTECFDPCVLQLIGGALEDFNLSYEVEIIENFWSYSMRDAVDPGSSCLPITERTGPVAMKNYKDKSIELRKVLQNIVDISVGRGVDCSPDQPDVTRLMMWADSSNLEGFKNFTKYISQIKKNPRCPPLDRCFIKSAFIKNEHAVIDFNFPLVRPEKLTCENQRGFEDIFEDPIKYIRSLAFPSNPGCSGAKSLSNSLKGG